MNIAYCTARESGITSANCTETVTVALAAAGLKKLGPICTFSFWGFRVMTTTTEVTPVPQFMLADADTMAFAFPKGGLIKLPVHATLWVFSVRVTTAELFTESAANT